MQKNEEMPRKLWEGQLYPFKYPNHEVLEGEEEEQDNENLFEQIMKETFPDMAKEIDFRNSREPRDSQRSWAQRGTHQGTSSLSCPRVKIKRES